LPSAVLSVSPSLLRALELSGTPEDAALLERLQHLATTHEVLAQPFSSIDEEAWREAGLVDELKAQYDAGRATIEEVLHVEPTQGTTIVDASANPDTLAMLSDLGTKVFIFDENRLSPLPSGYSTPPTRLFNLQNSHGVGLSVDPELRRMFAGDSVLNANRLIADLSALYFDVANAKGQARDERHGVVVMVPDDWSASTQFMSVITTAMQTNPLLRATNFSNIFELSSSGTDSDTAVATPSQGILTRGLNPDPPKALGQYPAALRQTSARLDSVTQLLETQADSKIAPLRELLLVSGDDRLDASERTTYLDQANNFVDRALKGVSFTGPHRVTLTAQEDTIPIMIMNDPANPPLHVRVELRTDPRLDFPDGPFIDIDPLVPGPNRRDVRVRSRTPGSTNVDVSITSPDGNLRLATQQYKIRSVALSGVGLGLSIAALVVLFTWWFRNHRSTRRAKALVATGGP
jgi:hypothetical protein